MERLNLKIKRLQAAVAALLCLNVVILISSFQQKYPHQPVSLPPRGRLFSNSEKLNNSVTSKCLFMEV
jgi:hypothetical protein